MSDEAFTGVFFRQLSVSDGKDYDLMLVTVATHKSEKSKSRNKEQELVLKRLQLMEWYIPKDRDVLFSHQACCSRIRRSRGLHLFR